jgi:hypothetical protein
LSKATAFTARFPSLAGSVQTAVNGASESLPRDVQRLLEQPALVSWQTENSMWSMSPSGLVAVTVNGSASAAFTYWPGSEIITVGAWLSTFTVTDADVRELPALSVATARTS